MELKDILRLRIKMAHIHLRELCHARNECHDLKLKRQLVVQIARERLLIATMRYSQAMARMH